MPTWLPWCLGGAGLREAVENVVEQKVGEANGGVRYAVRDDELFADDDTSAGVHNVRDVSIATIIGGGD
jgi:hypothetical protein